MQPITKSSSQAAVRVADNGDWSLAAFCFATVALAASASAQTTISGLDGLAKLPGASPTAVSNGGYAVAGATGVYAQAWRWTRGGSTEDLGFLWDPNATGYVTVPHGISADGSVVAGTCLVIGSTGISGQNNAFRWTSPGGMQQLAYGTAEGISADGSIIVGYKDEFPQYGPGRWASDGTFQVIGSLGANAIACNFDGSKVVINYTDSSSGASVQGVLLWNNGVSVDLGKPAGWTDAIATAMASDGSAVTGYGYSPIGQRAFRWTMTGGMQDLGMLPEHVQAQPRGISGDGSVVVGWAYSSTLQSQRAFLWTSWLGMVDLREYLSAQAVDVAGWYLSGATAISPDGSAIVGDGYSQDGAGGWFSTWIVRDMFPAPWTDIGYGLAGVNGLPQLDGTGVLIPGTPGSLDLTSAAPDAATLLLVSTTSTPAQFLGGTLIPIPFVLALPLVTDATGAISLTWPAWPVGLPFGSTLYFQYVVEDGAAMHGAAQSNAVKAKQP